MEFLNVQPMVSYLYDKFISSSSPSVEEQVRLMTDDIISARAVVSGGKASVTFAGTTYLISPRAVPHTPTADGGLVTELHLFIRSFLLSLLGPALQQRYDRMPNGMVEAIRTYCMKFWAGGSVGGAIVDSGVMWISPHWLPVPPPLPLEAVSATIEDPVVRFLHLWAAETQDGENAKKGARLSADPYFTLLAMKSNSMIDTFDYELKDIDGLDWHVALSHAGGDGADVISRPGTFVPAESGDSGSHWMTSAFDDLLGSGYILSLLQMPRACLYNRLLDRVVVENGEHWFVGTDKDYKLTVGANTDLSVVATRPYDWKMTWLDTLRGVPLGSARRVSALRASPLGGIVMSAEFNSSYVSKSLDTLAVTEAVRAWIRSDPACPPQIKWVADVATSQLSQAWFPASSDAYFKILKGIS